VTNPQHPQFAPDIRKPAGFPLYGPAERWISNPLQLVTLQDIDRSYAAAGLPTRHDAEIADLLASDLSPEVGRYYPALTDFDEAGTPERQAEYRLRVEQWLAWGDNPPQTADPPSVAPVPPCPRASSTPDDAGAESPNPYVLEYRRRRALKRLRAKNQLRIGQALQLLFDGVLRTPPDGPPKPRRRRGRRSTESRSAKSRRRDSTFSHATIPPNQTDNPGLIEAWPIETPLDEPRPDGYSSDEASPDEFCFDKSNADEPRPNKPRPDPEPATAARPASKQFRILVATVLILAVLHTGLIGFLAWLYRPRTVPPAAATTSRSISAPRAPPRHNYADRRRQEVLPLLPGRLNGLLRSYAPTPRKTAESRGGMGDNPCGLTATDYPGM
jgi:hypothetical protein